MLPVRRTARRALLVRATVAVATGSLALGLGLGAPSAADTAPPSGVPATVSADPLPTWQLNGVVNSQVTVGSTVFVTGSFTKARPPGVPVGGAGEVTANNLFAYDLRTGARVAGFRASLNGAGQVITVSRDRSKIYVGGDFTKANGWVRSRVAAFSTSGRFGIQPYRPTVNGRVAAIAVTSSHVLLGGSFTAVGSATRMRLAKTSLTGSLTSWNPTADAPVLAMVLTASDKRVIVGGAFARLGAGVSRGMGSLSVATGARLAWYANATIHNSNTGGINSLRTDGTLIYGSAYQFEGRSESNFEGTFAAQPLGGRLVWANDCLGDTYDVLPVGSVLYSVGHAHDCSSIGAFPEGEPRINQRAMASPTYATGVNTGPDAYGWNYAGVPAAKLLTWWPRLGAGTVTGMNQAAFSLTGNADYIALGGEFPTVNGQAQQGLVRFARTALAPNDLGANAPTFRLDQKSPAPGTVDVTWWSQWDPDNETLTYRLFRDGAAQPVHVVTQKTSFWSRPTLSFQDTGLSGGQHTYRVEVSDPFGNIASSPTDTITVEAPPPPAGQEAAPEADGAGTDGAGTEGAGTEGAGTEGAGTTG